MTFDPRNSSYRVKGHIAHAEEGEPGNEASQLAVGVSGTVAMYQYASLIPGLPLLPHNNLCMIVYGRSKVIHRIIVQKEGEPGDEQTCICTLVECVKIGIYTIAPVYIVRESTSL